MAYEKGYRQNLNRIKIVITEQKRTIKWVARQLNKDVATVSQWCNNRRQPDLYTLFDLAKLLMVDVRTLLQPNDVDSTDNIAAKPSNDYGLNETIIIFDGEKQ